MNSRRLTNMLLLAIALGLWAHLIVPLLTPPAIAGDRVQVEVVNEVRVTGSLQVEPRGAIRIEPSDKIEVEMSPSFSHRPLEVKVVN